MENWMDGITTEQRLQWLRRYNDFSQPAEGHLFHYWLCQRAQCLDVLEAYRLDRLVGERQDIDGMFALLDWVCATFHHDGSTARLPKAPDPRALVEHCKQNNNATNCRGLSLLLSQLLRAYGIPARHVTCLPYEDQFRDCHVVVEAYSQRLGQWILLDPTHCLALRDAQGQWCSLQRLRSALVRGEPLTPRETIQYNGGPYKVESYRAYMAKNLFRLACARELVHGGDGVGIILEPVGYQSELFPEYSRSHSEAAFWEDPMESLSVES